MGKWGYKASFGQQYTDGLSAVTTGNEKDAFSRTNVGVGLNYAWSKNLSINAFANQDRFTTEYDTTFPIFDDADFTSLTDQYRFGIAPQWTYKNGSLQVNTAFQRIERTFYDDFSTRLNAKSWVFDAYNKYNINDRLYTVIGLNYIVNKVQFTEEKDITNTDPYLNVVWVSGFGLNLNAGARLNNHSEYGSHLTYNFNPSYTHKFDDNYIKALASYSTSFIAPSLSQLFGAFGPNPNLKPEENRTLELGTELNFGKKLLVNLVYFNRKEKNFIDFVIVDFETFEGEYQNVLTDFEVQGVEVGLAAEITGDLRLNANYSFTEKKDVVVIRLPKHKVNASLNYNFSKKNHIGLNYQFVGERNDNDFSRLPSAVVLGTFSLFDVDFWAYFNRSKTLVIGIFE